MFVDYDVDKHLVFVRQVFAQTHVASRVAKAFVLVVFLYDIFDAVNDILGNLVALDELQALLQVFDFALLGTGIFDIGYTGLCAENDFEPSLVAYGLLELDSCLGKEGLAH